MFSEFKLKIAKDYTILTTILLLCVSVVIYLVEFSMSYKEQLHQLNMLSIEEGEEIFYKLRTGTADSFDNADELPDSDSSYFNKIFVYAYGADSRPLFIHNNISWSRDDIESAIADGSVSYHKAYIKFELLDGRHPKSFIYMRYPLLKGGDSLGEVYVGIEITHWVREQARILLILLFVILLSTIAVRFISLKMAEKAMVPVEKSFEQEKQFIANASHELRTPLSIIMSGITVLESDADNKLSPFSNDIVADIRDESLRMKKLIDDLLLTARSDNNTLKINPAVFSLNELLLKLYGKFSLLSAQKNIALNIKGDMPPRADICADKSHIEQILVILLDNALKYTAEGGSVDLTLTDSKHTVAVSVKDSGRGISKEDLPHIFERFYRADKARTQPGNGLGLSIAQLLASKNNARITAESELGKGSVFSLVYFKNRQKY